MPRAARPEPPDSSSAAPAERSAGALPAALPRGRVLRRAPGRETALAELGPGEALIVKRYAAGSGWWGRRRAVRAARVEHDNARALGELGIAVPRALGWRREGEEALVGLELVRHRETLRELLERAPADERRRRAAELLELVVRLHGAGWFHRDLYLQHVLVRAADRRLVLIDLGRALRRRRPRARWLRKDLAALLHSTPEAVAPRERLRFLARYLDRRGIRGRRRRRRWARAVLAKERRMARHAPRHGESFPVPEEWRG